MGVYAVERFAIEIVRAKGDRIAFGISISQVVSIILLAVAILVWIIQSRKPEQSVNAVTSTARARK
jgi:prolipoprotein diacylglyceryltransferase